jgi:hypothetical protein
VSQRFFCFDGYSFQTHATEDEARNEAAGALECARDAAGDGWKEEVEQICWGRIEEQVELTSSEKAPEGSPFDTLDEYALRGFADEPVAEVKAQEPPHA